METSLVRPAARARTRLSALTKLTMFALIGLALALVYVQTILIRDIRPDLMGFAVVMVIVAAVCATGWRWIPLIGALLSSLVVAGNSEAVIGDLTHPELFRFFTFMIVAVSLAVVGMVAGVSATVQNYRSRERRTPRVMVPALTALVALGIGATLVGSLPRAASTGVSPEVLAGLPAVSTPAFRFDQTEIKVKVGETVALRLDNTHEVPHSFDIDELNVHVPMTSKASGLALFKPTTPGTYTYYCALPGHRALGMEGKLIVEP